MFLIGKASIITKDWPRLKRKLALKNNPTLLQLTNYLIFKELTIKKADASSAGYSFIAYLIIRLFVYFFRAPAEALHMFFCIIAKARPCPAILSQQTEVSIPNPRSPQPAGSWLPGLWSGHRDWRYLRRFARPVP